MLQIDNNVPICKYYNSGPARCYKVFFSFVREFQLRYEELVIPGRNVSDVLEIVFKNYDKRIRPFYGGIKAY